VARRLLIAEVAGCDVSARLAALLSIAPLLVVACGSTSMAATPAADVITGGASCPADEKQDLTFKGAITGHISCSTTSAACTKEAANGRSSAGVAAPINLRVGSTPVQLLFAFSDDKTETVSAGKLGDDPTSTPDGATLDGLGHWETTTNGGGSMTIAADDATSASGSVDVNLSSEKGRFSVSGSWRCVKPAGF
jgi:hypothetical protein